MFSENLKTLRQEKGFSQEELAARLHVVRQTISKWEKGRSVPDADLLIRLAEILETSVSELLGGPVETPSDKTAVSLQLERLNEILAERNRRNRRIWKSVIIVFLALLIGFLLLSVLGVTLFSLRLDSSTLSDSSALILNKLQNGVFAASARVRM